MQTRKTPNTDTFHAVLRLFQNLLNSTLYPYKLYMYVCVLGNKKCWFFQKFCVRTKCMTPKKSLLYVSDEKLVLHNTVASAIDAMSCSNNPIRADKRSTTSGTTICFQQHLPRPSTFWSSGTSDHSTICV